MVGSERLSQLQTPGVGEEFAEALALARDELGATRVRAHAIFHDDLGVYRFGEHDFTTVDAVYDRVLELGYRPVVELSFMPRELAADPEATVFEYGAGISVPHDWEAWGTLCRDLAEHLVERYGIDEVAHLGLRGLERGQPRGLLDRYARRVLQALRPRRRGRQERRCPAARGRPGDRGRRLDPDFLDHVVETGAPLDFVTTHTYGNLPLDVRESLRVRGLEAGRCGGRSGA